MKTVLRTSGLVAALTLAFFTARPAFPVNGLCHTTCFNPITKLKQYTWISTQADCCNKVLQLCAPGDVQGLYIFTPTGGTAMICGAS